jgi:hypothetical protein
MLPIDSDVDGSPPTSFDLVAAASNLNCHRRPTPP